MADFLKVHKLQKEHMDNDVNKEDRKVVHDSWFKEDTADYWRHARMYESIRPLACLYRGSQWLSVGDGRYGLDACRLRRIFELDVLPTDISENPLKNAKELGLINDYKVENAEDLSFADNSFDVVFCKESYHHFPRPIIALYEMIRVARKAVVLIEPNDRSTLVPPKLLIKQLVKLLFNNLLPNNQVFDRNYSFFTNYGNVFEDSGNYLYALSKRETEKIVQGMNLPGMASFAMNDYYVKGCEFESADPDNDVFKTIKRNIEIRDAKCRRSPLFHGPGLLTIVIFKTDIEPSLQDEMVSFGYAFSNTKRNPHLT